ncbi:MAG TPA: response regulator [Polyangia bacterium]|nr:response regulator [Polyangia bacterium]
MSEEAKKASVLVVDDEPLNRDLLRRVLTWDYQIEEAPDGREALALIKAQRFEVVVADHAMPFVSGVELLRHARADAPATVGLLLTGYEDLPEVQQAQAEGVVFGVIGKPFDQHVLLDLVRRAVEESRQRRK